MRRPLSVLLVVSVMVACSGSSDEPPEAAASGPGPSSGGAGGAGASGGAGGSAAGSSAAGSSAAGSSAAAGSGGFSGASGGSGQGGLAGQGGSAGSGQAGAAGAGAAGASGAGGSPGVGGASGQGGSSGQGGGAGGQAGSGGQGQAVTTLRVHYPLEAGHQITIRGDAGELSWEAGKAATKAGEGVYEYTTSAFAQAAEWKPMLDDATWSRGPNYHVQPGATVDVYPHFNVSSGKVELYKQGFHSQKLPNDRDVWVYLPPTYLENSLVKVPVVYMHDGQNLFDPQMAFGGNEWQVDETMDAGAESGSIREAIVVGVGNTAARIYEYTPTYDATEMDGGGGDAYLALLADELKPLVDQDFRTLSSREDTALLGSSLGGLISAHGGVKRPETFGLVGAMSPSTWWDNDFLIGEVATVKSAPLKALRVYVDSGDSGPSNDDVTQTKELAQTYESVGYQMGKDLSYVVQMGAVHNEIYWAQRLPGALAFLLGPRPD